MNEGPPQPSSPKVTTTPLSHPSMKTQEYEFEPTYPDAKQDIHSIDFVLFIEVPLWAGGPIKSFRLDSLTPPQLTISFINIYKVSQ